MKKVVYGTLTAFRGVIFMICKLWLGLGLLLFFVSLGVALFADMPATIWISVAILLVIGCIVPQMILIYYNRLIAHFADGAVYLPE